MTERLILAMTIIIAISLLGVALRRGVSWQRRNLQLAGQLAANGLPLIAAFSSAGCGGCTVQRRIIESVIRAWEGPVEVTHIDAVAQPDLAREFGVITVPTTVVAAPDGTVVSVNGGVVDEQRLHAQLVEAASSRAGGH